MDKHTALETQLVAEVRALMAQRGATQSDIVRLTGIPQATLARRLSGNGRGFTVQELIRIAEALGSSLLDLTIRAERNAAQVAA